MQYRNEFLAHIDKITKTPDKLNPICPDDVKPLIRVVHDESTYYANCHQLYVWGDDENNKTKNPLGNPLWCVRFC